jgi:hypothetical protein
MDYRWRSLPLRESLLNVTTNVVTTRQNPRFGNELTMLDCATQESIESKVIHRAAWIARQQRQFAKYAPPITCIRMCLRRRISVSRSSISIKIIDYWEIFCLIGATENKN